MIPERSPSNAEVATAHTMPGDDAQARQDIERAVSLGFPRDALEYKITQVTGNR